MTSWKCSINQRAALWSAAALEAASVAIGFSLRRTFFSPIFSAVSQEFVSHFVIHSKSSAFPAEDTNQPKRLFPARKSGKSAPPVRYDAPI